MNTEELTKVKELISTARRKSGELKRHLREVDHAIDRVESLVTGALQQNTGRPTAQ